MFTTVGAAIGLFLGLITIISCIDVFLFMTGLGVLLTYLIVLFSFMSFGAFAGMIIDYIIEKLG